ncbi:hypothetical protein [Croceimicrobium hydrocarbonivorans]|uniref:Uncharacterized protein n=1 Tax=Croceimicrobium hydrocarbonivorans TaxID=2761580 RepID=A0A7H0VAC1_9FLAO|nr:hypothetical protein [Croceimicrobium hydrocarbonivorans]QNR22669.1 hypothetical protein H4K34_09770 [Croceimicrobium hydrocarbonivorans]
MKKLFLLLAVPLLIASCSNSKISGSTEAEAQAPVDTVVLTAADSAAIKKGIEHALDEKLLPAVKAQIDSVNSSKK